MKKTLLLTILIALTVSAPALCGSEKTAGGYTIKSDVFNASGGAFSSGGGYNLSSSAGQQAGYSQSGDANHSVSGGFLGIVDRTPPAAAFLLPAASSSLSGIIVITANVQDKTGVNWSLSYGPGTAPTMWKEIASGTTAIVNNTLASWDASGLTGEYTLRIAATDGRGNAATGSVSFTIGNSTVTAYTIPRFKWIFMSLQSSPSPSDPVSIFGAEQIYKVYRWNPEKEPSPDLDRYEYPATLSAGGGFWIHAYYEDLPYSITGTLADTSRDFVMPIKTGWNMIGSPFNRQYPANMMRIRDGATIHDFNTAVSLGLISQNIYHYDPDAASWVLGDGSTVFQPLTGYILRGYGNYDVLFDPGAGLSGGLARVIAPHYDYRVKISATTDSAADTDNFAAASRSALPGFDRLDAEEPIRDPSGSYVSLYFQRDNWSVPGRYAADVRPTQLRASQTESFPFNVDTNITGKTVTLSWDSAKLPSDKFSFTLIDSVENISIDMSRQNTYTFESGSAGITSRPFELIVKTISGDATTSVLRLSDGWNLVSVPVEPELTSALALLGKSIPLFTVYQFLNGNFYPNESADVQPGTGFWINVTGNTEVKIPGTLVTAPVTIQLAPGWNAIGNPFGRAIPWDDSISFNCGGRSIPLSQAASENLVDVRLFEYTGEDYVHSNTIEPMKGYFLKSRGSCSLTLSP